MPQSEDGTGMGGAEDGDSDSGRLAWRKTCTTFIFFAFFFLFVFLLSFLIGSTAALGSPGS